MTPSEQKINDDVTSHGWHVIKVGDPQLPDFAYSIGLYKNFHHPELIIFGLSLEEMHSIINGTGEIIRKGRRFSAGQASDEILEGFPCTFRLVPRSQYHDHLGWAEWFYGGADFPALQLVWPDKEGRYPWQVEQGSWLRSEQPVLDDIGRAV